MSKTLEPLVTHCCCEALLHVAAGHWFLLQSMLVDTAAAQKVLEDSKPVTLP